MGLDLDLIDRLVRLVETSRLAELDYEAEGRRIRIVAGVPGAGPVTTAGPVAASSVQDRAANVPGATPPHLVRSGLTGVFYHAPSPDSPPFVAVGDVVADGQTLGIVEAMKLFNPVEADRAGRIAAVLVENGATVGTGTPLFAIEPQGIGA